MSRVLALLLLALAPPFAVAAGLSPQARDVLQAGLTETADAVILPAYQAQAEAATDLAVAMRALCADDGASDRLDRARAAFVDTLLAWRRASIVGVGPIAEAEGPMRVQLWPDPKGFSRRAAAAAVRAEDPALLAPGGLAGRSVALINLTALEALLWRDPPPSGYGCRLAAAIAAYQADLATDLAAQWRPGAAFRDDYDAAGDGAGRFRSVEDLLRRVMAGAVVHVDRLRKFHLLRGLGAGPGAARPGRTEARLSGAGLASLETGLRALGAFYEAPLGLFDIAPDVGGSLDYLTLAQSAFAAADAVAVMDGAMAEIAAEDGARAAALRRLADPLLRHEAFLKSGFLGAMGLSAGFTAADGD